jgi:hypothetical protein
MQNDTQFPDSEDAQLAAAMQQLQPPTPRPTLHAHRQTPLRSPLFNPPPPPPPVAALENVKLPTFDVNRPTLWFNQTESIFRRSNVTAQIDCYDIVIAHLPSVALDAVADILNSTGQHTADCYNRLKNRLLATYGKTPAEMANLMHDHPSLGDARPTHLMNSLLAHLPPGETPGVLFMSFFMRRLPTYLRDQLAGFPTDDPNRLAQQADKIWSQHGGAAAAINRLATTPTSSNRRRSPTPYRRRSPSPHSNYCFYHQRFGDRAQKCQPPCSYRPKND